jgi:hypothetical protein
MPAPAIAGLRFPHERVLLGRTKLAYVHLRNLLTDAKRDRAARVFGYVAIWLADGLLVLYLQEGEVVNATHSADGETWQPLPIAEAIAKVPPEPELGEICFHEADDEQLACMWEAQHRPDEPWPMELEPTDARTLFPYLRATTFDGMMEIGKDGSRHYLVFRDGSVVRTFLADDGQGPVPARVLKLFDPSRHGGRVSARRWGVPPALPVQASPALIGAYRDLVRRLIERLQAGGSGAARELAESARVLLVERHPELMYFPLGVPGATPVPTRDPVVTPEALTRGIAAWVGELLFATSDYGGATPESVLSDLTRERRHMLQSAGFYELLPWTVTF